MDQQQRATIQTIMVDLGARFNAEAIRIGDSAQAAIEQLVRANNDLQKQNEELAAENKALKDAAAPAQEVA